MPKPPADPITLANAAWIVAMRDADYAAWYRQRLRELIRICEWPDRKAELVKLIKEMEAVNGGTTGTNEGL